MTEEELLAHRELQYLRAAGISSSHRRGRRRKRKPTNQGQAELSSWVDARGAKLAMAREERP